MLWKPLSRSPSPAGSCSPRRPPSCCTHRGVRHLATDAPSFGAAEDPQAGPRRRPQARDDLDRVGDPPRAAPLRGAFFVSAPYKVREQQAGIARAFAFTQRGAAAVESSAPLQL